MRVGMRHKALCSLGLRFEDPCLQKDEMDMKTCIVAIGFARYQINEHSDA